MRQHIAAAMICTNCDQESRTLEPVADMRLCEDCMHAFIEESTE
jgi:hypothetical protein